MRLALGVVGVLERRRGRDVGGAEGAARVEVEAGHTIGDVVLDGVFGDAEMRGDLDVAIAQGDELLHPPLTGGERQGSQGRGGRGSRRDQRCDLGQGKEGAGLVEEEAAGPGGREPEEGAAGEGGEVGDEVLAGVADEDGAGGARDHQEAAVQGVAADGAVDDEEGDGVLAVGGEQDVGGVDDGDGDVGAGEDEGNEVGGVGVLSMREPEPWPVA